MTDSRIHSHDSIAGGHEPPTFETRRVLLWVAALVALISTAAGLMYVLLLTLRSERPQAEPLSDVKRVESVRAPLDPSQVSSRHAYEQQQHELLTGYGWVDAQEQIARIPIKRAIQLYEQQQGSEQ